jgi:hypothetical protein
MPMSILRPRSLHSHYLIRPYLLILVTVDSQVSVEVAVSPPNHVGGFRAMSKMTFADALGLSRFRLGSCRQPTAVADGYVDQNMNFRRSLQPFIQAKEDKQVAFHFQ